MSLRFDVEVSLALGADITADPGTWAWTDITAYVMLGPDGGASITRGRLDEWTTVTPSRCTVRLNNADGRFTRLNPNGAYYGQLAKNTPIRIRACATGGSLVTRFVGFVSEWPPRWTPGQLYEWVPVRADGVLRRLGQGSAPKSAPRRFYEAASPQPFAAWPLEDDGSIATRSTVEALYGPPLGFFGDVQFGASPSPLGVHGRAMRFVGGWAAGNGETAASYLATEVLGWSTTPTEMVIEFAYACDAVNTGPSGTTGGHFAIGFDDPDPAAPNSLQITVSQLAGTLVGFAVANPFAGAVQFTTANPLDGVPHHVRVELVENAGDIDVEVFWDGTSVGTDTLASTTIGAFQRLFAPYFALWFTPDAGNQVWGMPVVLSHLAIYDDVSAPSGYEASTGHNGESDVDRFNRVCTEDGIPHVTATGDGVLLGPQPLADTVTILRDSEAAGQGVLYEALAGGLAYQPLSARYNLTVDLELDHDSGHIVPEFNPADDDQQTRNDITVTRTDGSTSPHARDEDSIAAVGLYDDAKTLNLYSDLQVGDAAGWLLWMGTSTANEYRYPVVTLALHKSSSLVTDWLTCDIGSRITIDNMPADVTPDLADLIIEGWTERVNSVSWDVTF